MRKFTAVDWVAIGVIIGIGILANADTTYAAGTTLKIADIYNNAKDAITGIYGALFTIAAGIIGIVEYFMSGKNIGILLTCIVVGLAPHLLIWFISFAFSGAINAQTGVANQ